MNRRKFLTTGASASIAFLGLQRYLSAKPSSSTTHPYGPLLSDPNGILDLPKGFKYQILSKTGDTMDDGLRVPGMPDGMAAFPAGDDKVVLVCNHELPYGAHSVSAHAADSEFTEVQRSLAYGIEDDQPCSGGTTNLVYNLTNQKVEKQFLSLLGTDRNCAGGAMPWGSWITCEEPADLTSSRGRKHGYCFEVTASDDGKLQKATPLKGLGRFRHEAVALDPESGILYLTEDVGDGLLYRFIPDKKNDLSAGKLQALAISGSSSTKDLRNYTKSSKNISVGSRVKVKWIDLEDIDSPRGDLRLRGHNDGAAKFARGEGIIYSNGSLYICCTEGGPKRKGQIYKLTPGPRKYDKLELFLEPSSTDLLTNGDNICAAPWGDLVICEDLCGGYKSTQRAHIQGITPDGKIYAIARNAKDSSEFAGSCFSPDGSTLFANMQGLGLTIAITGPWKRG